MTGMQLDITDLPLAQVDSSSPIPLYHQIEADLRLLIGSGQVAPGDLLPPEIALAKAYHVGRHTVREALSRLAAEGLIVRKAGRGTMVQSPPNRARFYLDRSFTRQMAELGLSAHSRVLSFSLGTIERHLPQPLQEQCGAGCFHLARLRLGNGEPIGLQYTTIVTERCPGIDRYDFNTQSLYDVLSTEYHLAITEIAHMVRAVTASPVQAELLGIAPGDSLLQVKTSAYLASGELIEFTLSYYRADKYEFSTTHTIHDT